MPRKKNEDEYDMRALAAAIWRAEGTKQEKIADRLGVSQPEVSRLLSHACKKKWYSQEPSVVRHEVAEDLWRRTEEEYFSCPEVDELVRRWAPDPMRCQARVVSAENREIFGLAAGQIVAGLLQQSELLGVEWGRSVAALVRGIARVCPKPPRGQESDRLRVIPLSGEPLCLPRGLLEYSATHLAWTVDKLFNKRPENNPINLSGTPSYIPSSLDAREAKAVRKFVELFPGYRKVYGCDGEEGLADELDTMVTGAGVVIVRNEPGERTGAFLNERVVLDKILETELNDLVYGDIGGVLIPRPNLKAAQRKRVEAMNRGWLGIQERHLRRCAVRVDGKGSGVIAVVTGSGKAELLRAAVQAGLLNVVVMDKELAREVIDLEPLGGALS